MTCFHFGSLGSDVIEVKNTAWTKNITCTESDCELHWDRSLHNSLFHESSTLHLPLWMQDEPPLHSHLSPLFGAPNSPSKETGCKLEDHFTEHLHSVRISGLVNHQTRFKEPSPSPCLLVCPPEERGGKGGRLKGEGEATKVERIEGKENRDKGKGRRREGEEGKEKTDGRRRRRERRRVAGPAPPPRAGRSWERRPRPSPSRWAELGASAPPLPLALGGVGSVGPAPPPRARRSWERRPRPFPSRWAELGASAPPLPLALGGVGSVGPAPSPRAGRSWERRPRPFPSRWAELGASAPPLPLALGGVGSVGPAPSPRAGRSWQRRPRPGAESSELSAIVGLGDMAVGCAALLGLLVLLGLCAGQSVKFKDCGSQTGKVIAVDITACSSLPCELHKGKRYDVNVTFVSLTASETSKANVYGILSGIHLPFPLPIDDGCKSGIQCPIRKNQKYNYLNSLQIKNEYPSIELVVEWKLLDDKNRNIFCWEVPVQISD
ncbi:uncharacterized protein [Narcine bancroftii]|uniref:uncharacterized protein n=1 Tax=Narcine bancroftii TaxID=1343680 RepID=UPI0038314FD8